MTHVRGAVEKVRTRRYGARRENSAGRLGRSHAFEKATRRTLRTRLAPLMEQGGDVSGLRALQHAAQTRMDFQPPLDGDQVTPHKTQLVADLNQRRTSMARSTLPGFSRAFPSPPEGKDVRT